MNRNQIRCIENMSRIYFDVFSTLYKRPRSTVRVFSQCKTNYLNFAFVESQSSLLLTSIVLKVQLLMFYTFALQTVPT